MDLSDPVHGEGKDEERRGLWTVKAWRGMGSTAKTD